MAQCEVIAVPRVGGGRVELRAGELRLREIRVLKAGALEVRAREQRPGGIERETGAVTEALEARQQRRTQLRMATHLTQQLIDARTGAVRTVVAERSATFVDRVFHPEHGVAFDQLLRGRAARGRPVGAEGDAVGSRVTRQWVIALEEDLARRRRPQGGAMRVAHDDKQLRAGFGIAQDDFVWDSHGDTNGNGVRNQMTQRIVPGLRTFLTRIVDGETGGTLNSGAKSAALSIFEGTKQRFFAQLLLSMKLPSLLPAIDTAIADGYAVVVQLVSTAEAMLNRRLADLSGEEREALEIDLSPREYI